MACTDGPTKLWSQVADKAVFTLSVSGPEAGGFTAKTHVYRLTAGQPAQLLETWLMDNLEEKKYVLSDEADYFITTHVLIYSAGAIDVAVRTRVTGKTTHCTTISGASPTSGHVEHTVVMA